MLLSSAGCRDCSDHCRISLAIQIPWLHHLLAAGTAPTIVEHHGQFKQHCLIICWRPTLIQPLSKAVVFFKCHGFITCWRLRLLQQLLNAMATSNTIAPSSAGGRDCSNHCQEPWSLQIPWLHHLLAAATAPTIVKHHGEFKYHCSIICWQPRLPLLLTPLLTTNASPLDDLCQCLQP